MTQKDRTEYYKEYWQGHKEEKREYDKKWYQDHKEEINEQTKQYYLNHKKETKERQAQYYRDNKKEILERLAKYRQSHKKEEKDRKHRVYLEQRLIVMNHYGGKCAFCGNTNVNHLCIDHINNDGAEHRKTIGRQICRWLIKNNFPDGFQVLCYNHNAEKQFSGTQTLATYNK